jgi:hypothetical protein
MSKSYTIGRKDAGRAEILLHGDTISARHADLSIDSRGRLLLRDIGSSNGTRVIRNAKEIPVSSVPVSLLPTDIVWLGKEWFGIDELLAKIPAKRSSAAPSPADRSPAGSEIKMRRCSACGCVTPLTGACIECGYSG